MPLLPLAVTIGFSGPCRWFNQSDHPDLDPSVFQDAARMFLVEQLGNLPKSLGLADHHFLSGISQIAVGGDHAFTEACQELGIPQRIFLPQPSDVFLDAVGSGGPDFSEVEKAKALSLLASPHIIQESVVSGASIRDIRFEETNIELIHRSDIVIAMIKAQGGRWTKDLIERAARWKTPVLLIKVSVENGLPAFEASWNDLERFKAPTHPKVLADLSFENESKEPLQPHSIPEKKNFFTTIKTHCSKQSALLNQFFQESAWIILTRHFFASACAVLSLVLLADYFRPHAYYRTLAVILAIEIVFLIHGYTRHRTHHKHEAGAHWAMNRLLSEVARSVIAFGEYHIGFSHLWKLNLPAESRPLLRTIEILQLRETRLQTATSWQDCRKVYLETRLIGVNPDPVLREKEGSPQINYYRKEFLKAKRHYLLAHKVFGIASLLAIAATVIKFVLVLVMCIHHEFHPDVFKAILGFLGVLLPVVAVAALSLAAAMDLEARAHTFKEMFDYLTRQADLIENAQSDREFSKLLTETESRLLGENVTWFSRRTFTGIA